MRMLPKAILSMLVLQAAGFSAARAGEGRAILPAWIKDPSPIYTAILVSNVSDEQVTINITLYNVDGSTYTESSESGTNFSVERGFSGDPMSSGGATLQANGTGELRVLGTGSLKLGYGEIKWTSSGSSRIALIASARQTIDTSTGLSFAVIPVNGFEPF